MLSEDSNLFTNEYNNASSYNSNSLLTISRLHNRHNLFHENSTFFEGSNIILNYLNNLLQEIENTRIENQEPVAIVITEESLNSLEVKKYSELDEDLKTKNQKCMITLSDFKDDDVVRILPCKHIYLKEGIDEWLLNNSNKCPVCRKEAGESKPKL